MKKYRAGIIGLGQVANTFDFEKERAGSIWTHAGAYQFLADQVSLVAGADLDEQKRTLFCQKRDINSAFCFSDYCQMLAQVPLDLLSVCVPTPYHYEVVKEALKYPLKGIIVEKPIALNTEQAQEIVSLTEQHKVKLLVMYNRRYWYEYQQVRQLILAGKVGKIISVVGFYTSQIFNIGSHLFNTMSFLINEKPQWVSAHQTIADEHDPTLAGTIGYSNNIMGYFIPNNQRRDAFFDIKIIGTDGVIDIRSNARFVEWHEMIPSDRYAGYRELAPLESVFTTRETNSHFVKAVQDLITTVDTNTSPISSGQEAFSDVLLIEKALLSAANNSQKFFL